MIDADGACAAVVRVAGEENGTECSAPLEDDVTDDEDDQAVLNLGSGRRLWDSSAVHPAGVKKWDNARNCHAALEFKQVPVPP